MVLRKWTYWLQLLENFHFLKALEDWWSIFLKRISPLYGATTQSTHGMTYTLNLGTIGFSIKNHHVQCWVIKTAIYFNFTCHWVKRALLYDTLHQTILIQNLVHAEWKPGPEEFSGKTCFPSLCSSMCSFFTLYPCLISRYQLYNLFLFTFFFSIWNEIKHGEQKINNCFVFGSTAKSTKFGSIEAKLPLTSTEPGFNLNLT